MTDRPESGDYVQAFMADRPTDPATSALVVVDMQYATGHRTGGLAKRMEAEGSTVTDWRFERIHSCVIPNTQRLIRATREAGGLVLYVTIGAANPDCADAPPHMRAFFQQMENWVGSPQHEIVEELSPAPGDHVLRKTSIGAFASTGLDHLLRSLGRESLFVTGVSTNMCVETTAREAADRGYAVTLVEDACATTHKELHEGSCRNFARFFGKVRSTDEVMGLLA